MVTRDLRRERALVLAQKNPVAKVHRRKEAIKEVKRLFEAEEWEELSRALLPHVVVDKALDLAEFWWRVRVLCPPSVYVLNIFFWDTSTPRSTWYSGVGYLLAFCAPSNCPCCDPDK